MKRCPNTK